MNVCQRENVSAWINFSCTCIHIPVCVCVYCVHCTVCMKPVLIVCVLWRTFYGHSIRCSLAGSGPPSNLWQSATQDWDWDFPSSQVIRFVWQAWGWIGGMCVYTMSLWLFYERSFLRKNDVCVHSSLTSYAQLRMDTWWDCLKVFSMLVRWTFCFCLRHVQKLAVIAFHKKITLSLYSVPAVLWLVCLVLTLSSNRWGLGALCGTLSTSSVSSCNKRPVFTLVYHWVLTLWMFLSECGC